MLYDVVIKALRVVLQAIYSVLKLLPTRNKILIISRQSDTPSIDIELLRIELEEEPGAFKTVCLCKKLGDSLWGKIAYVFHMFRQMYHLATSKAVVLDSYCITVSVLKHKRELVVVQMWHALGLMKKAGRSAIGKEEGRSEAQAEAFSMHENYTYVFASSDACREAFCEVFGCDEDAVITMPLPRVDALRDDKRIEKTRARIFDVYPQIKGRKVVVYTPTFRKNEEGMEEKVNELIDSFDPADHVVIVKLHPLSHVEVTSDHAIIDTQFSSLEMLMAADYVISDYSAIVYEAAILEKPLFFYAFDEESYSDTRDLFFDYREEMPGLVTHDPKKVAQAIRADDFDSEKIHAFVSKYVEVRDGNAKEMAAFIKQAIFEARALKVGLVWLDVRNLGDAVIAETAQYLVEDTLKGLGVKEYDLRLIDIGDFRGKDMVLDEAVIEEYQERYKDKNRYVRAWKKSFRFHHFKDQEMPKLEGLDLIVFGGGGLIKFKKQFFYMYIDEITRYANEHRIPVIFNAVGIEGFDEEDTRCRILRTAITRSCVDTITTRDDLRMLSEDYLKDSKVFSAQVCDPALFVPETYGGIERASRSKSVVADAPRKVGIGVIRSKIFAEYDVDITPEELLVFYGNLLKELDERGVDYTLFTNGAVSDFNFILDLKEYLGAGEEFFDIVTPRPETARELVEQISEFERALFVRLHGGIIACSLGIPGVHLVWNEKQRYFALLTDQQENLIEKADMDAGDVIDRLMAAKPGEISEAYKQSAPRILKKRVRRILYRKKAKRILGRP